MTDLARAEDVWTRLRAATPARIGLGHVGGALPTAAMLDLERCHALARDAVHRPLDVGRALADLAPRAPIIVESRAVGREAYLRRPDLGRRLSERSAALIAPAGADIAIVLADGLSPLAAQTQGPPLVARLEALLSDLRLAPLVVAVQARVALGDEIGERLGAGFVIVLIGERPGLTAYDSLGAYLTFAPHGGRRDSERNCVSNVRAGGLSTEEAAGRIAWLYRAAVRLKATGTTLKDMSSATPAVGFEPHVGRRPDV